MRLLGTHEGYSNLIESFEDTENGSVIVHKFIRGTKLSKILEKYDEQMVPKTVLLDLLEKMLKRLAYLHETLYMVHRDPHFNQWFIQDDDSIILTDFTTAAVLGEDGVIPAGTEASFTPICQSPEQVRYRT